MNEQQLNSDKTNKKLMILGGSYLQVPAILEAKSMGLETAVVDYNPNCPGRILSDKFYPESTYDEEAVLKCAQDFKPDGIITLCTDWPMRSVAYVAEKLNLKSISYDSAVKSTNKHRMRNVLSAAKLGHAKYIHFNKAKHTVEELRKVLIFPCILKPVDSSGSRGVVLLRDPLKLDEAVDYSCSYSKFGEIIIEEFMEGPEVSVEIIILDGTPKVITITDKVTSGFPYFVETMHTEPSQLPTYYQEKIKELAIDSCNALGLSTGAAHVEIIYTTSGPKIVEVGPRMGGDFITTHLVPLSTGINMTNLLINEALGLEPKLPEVKSAAACIKYVQQQEGTFLGAENIDEIRKMENVIEAQMIAVPGKPMHHLKSSVDRIGYIITHGETVPLAIMYNDNAHHKLKIKVEK